MRKNFQVASSICLNGVLPCACVEVRGIAVGTIFDRVHTVIVPVTGV